MSQKRTSLLTFLLFLCLAFLPFVNNTTHFCSATYPPVLSVSHTPTYVEYQTNVSVTITFTDDTNVSSILIQYCALEPEFVCHFPKIVMNRIDANSWTGSFIVLEESGKIGYELYITYNDILYLAPNSSNFLGYSNIEEPSSGVFYFTINLSESSKTTPLQAIPLSIGVVFMIIVIIRGKRA